MHIVELASGTRTSFAVAQAGSMTWDAAGRLLVLDYSSATVGVYAADGRPISTWHNVGRQLTSSADGTAIVFWDGDGQGGFTLLTNEQLSQFPAPEAICQDPHPQLAPAGDAMVVRCSANSSEVVFLYELDDE